MVKVIRLAMALTPIVNTGMLVKRLVPPKTAPAPGAPTTGLASRAMAYRRVLSQPLLLPLRHPPHQALLLLRALAQPVAAVARVPAQLAARADLARADLAVEPVAQVQEQLATARQDQTTRSLFAIL